jgi:murein DD-endopeptidase MepM/ murein hydrolase activator NlpD
MAPDGPDTSLTIGDEDLRALPTPADMPAGSTSRRARRNNLLAEAEVKAQGRSTKLADAAAVPATRRTRRAEREHTPAVPSPVAVPEPHAALQPGPVAANPADLVIASAVNEYPQGTRTIIQDDPTDIAEHNAIVDEREAATFTVNDVSVEPVLAIVSPTIVLETEAVTPPLGFNSETVFVDNGTAVLGHAHLAEHTRPAFAPRTKLEAPAAAVALAPVLNRGRRVAAKSFSFAAFTVAGLLTLATSLPANALLSADDVTAQQVLVTEGELSTTVQTQTVVASGDRPLETVKRDSYGAFSAIDAAKELGIQPEATFTNNPNGTIQWPYAVGVHIGSDFGPRPGCSLGCSTDHKGQDFNPGLGAPIQAIADGVVVQSTDSGGAYGVKIVIEHVIDGQIIRTLYAHMLEGSRTVEVGDPVTVGQIIAKTGNSGRSTGPHLHLEVLLNGTDPVDPLAWLYANAN